jgi:hypothetical protein
MRVQSIRAAVQKRYVTGNRFLGLAVEMAFGKVHAIAEGHDLAQEIRTMTETLQDRRHLRLARQCAPLSVDLGKLAGGIRVLNQIDFALYSFFCYGCASRRHSSLPHCGRFHGYSLSEELEKILLFCDFFFSRGRT